LGSSFTEYRGSGFWSRDTKIELWLYLLSQEVQRLEAPPAWLRAAAEHWHIQATAGMNGCVCAELDTHAPNPERAAMVLELAETALAGLRARGEILSVAWLNELGLGGPDDYFTKDVPTAVFTPVGEALVQLLRGEITWDAARSPVL
jgi:hypothetical protein